MSWGVVKRMKVSPRKNNWILTLLLLALVASSCVLPAPRLVNRSATPYRPPTLAPTVLPTVGAVDSGEEAVNQPANCVDNLTFLSDLTVPDGTEVAPNARIDKRWEVENSGTCTWTGKYRFKLLTGEKMGVQAIQTLQPLKGGSKGAIRIMFTAPKEPGTYRSAWQAYNPDGIPFGDPVYIEIIVSEMAPSPTP